METTTESPPIARTQAERHDAHQNMLRNHAAIKQERAERVRKERFQGKPRKYPGHLY